MKKYILSIDQGTTSTRAILINDKGRGVYMAQRPVECFYPHPGWVEQDAERIWVSVVDVINELLIISGSSWEEIAAIGITNQRETSIVWDKNTGRPIYNAIVWQSKQTQSYCDEMAEKTEFIASKTGLRINPYFSASKIRFILDNVGGAQEAAEHGDLAFGTIDSWLVYKITKGNHYIDCSNASRTMLFNIHTMSWDDELLSLWNIPKKILPEVMDNDADFGEAKFFDTNVHVHGVAGDQQAALFGQCCFKKGESKNTYGTGCFMLMNTGSEAVTSKNGLLTTVAWRVNGETTYALEGSVFIGGAVIQWVRDQTRWIEDAGDSAYYACKRPDTGGVYFVPAFVGLGTPYWDDDARGAIFGLTRGVDRHNITRAALYSIAYQSKDVFDTMKLDAGLDLPVLKVDGGASKNDLLLQFQADILQCEVRAPEQVETTALGAGYIAGLGSGFWKSLDAIAKQVVIDRIFKPKMDKEEAERLSRGWKKAVEATRVFKVEE